MYAGRYIKIKKAEPTKNDTSVKVNKAKLKGMRSLLEGNKEIKKENKAR